jgi:hypothetical protein
VYVKVAVPALMPVYIPDTALIIAIVVSLLVQAPPGLLQLIVAELPTQAT